MLSPYLVTDRSLDDFAVHSRFAPRYQTYEKVLCRVFDLEAVHDTLAFRGFRAVWQQIAGTELIAMK